MHAVVVKVNIDDFEKGRRFLTEQVVPRVSQAPGFVAGYWTRSEDGSGGLSLIVFESEDAARQVAQMIESQGMADEGVTLEGTEVREGVTNA
jgi:heme-degrading monooxygenase HmoA